MPHYVVRIESEMYDPDDSELEAEDAAQAARDVLLIYRNALEGARCPEWMTITVEPAYPDNLVD